MELRIPQPFRAAQYLVTWFYVSIVSTIGMVGAFQLNVPILGTIAIAVTALVVSAPVLAVLWSIIEAVTPLGRRTITTLTLTSAALRVEDEAIPWETIDAARVLSTRGIHDLVVDVDAEPRVVASNSHWSPLRSLAMLIQLHAEGARPDPEQPRIPAALQAMRER